MSSEMQLDAKAQRHLDAYLDAVSGALARSGQTESVIQGILSDIRTQVHDMLRARVVGSPTEDDVCAVIAELDPPESYAEGAGSESDAPPTSATTPHEAASVSPRLSNLALAGICWAPFGLVFLYLLLFFHERVPAGTVPSGPHWWVWPLAALGASAPFGATILGWVAVAQIRHSAGRLYGLGLALADGLIYPLLALDGVLVALTLILMRVVWGQFWLSTWPYNGSALAIWLMSVVLAVLVIAWIDYVIVKRAWRAVNRPLPGCLAMGLGTKSGG